MPYRDSSTEWKSETFPCRVRAKVVVAVQSDYGVSVKSLRGKISIFGGRQTSWVGHVRGTLLEWEPADVEVIQRTLGSIAKR